MKLSFVTKSMSDVIDVFSSDVYVLFTLNNSGKILTHLDKTEKIRNLVFKAIEIIKKHKDDGTNFGEMTIDVDNLLLLSALWINVNKVEYFILKKNIVYEKRVIIYEINPKIFSFNLDLVKGV